MEKKDLVFQLDTKDTSYVMSVLPDGHLQNIYYGKRLRNTGNHSALMPKQAFYCWMVYAREEPAIGLDQQCLEYSSLGRGDYREPAIELTAPDGSFACDFLYRCYREYDGAKSLSGLPCALGEKRECRTLEIDLYDEVLDLTLTLAYGVYYDSNVITRGVTVKNGKKGALKLRRVMSLQLDLFDSDYLLTTFDGNWAMERTPHQKPLSQGIFVNDSKIGSSSSRHNPLILLQRPQTTEEAGECYGFNLIYSGNHYEAVEVTHFGKTRVLSGINPTNFSWELKEGESFESPQAVMTYSSQGLNVLSQQFHRFIQQHIVRGVWKNRERPVLVNNWEGTYFDFDEQKLLDMAKEASLLGIELFVLDDGWFGKRNDDQRSLGDWVVNQEKLPHGIAGLCEQVNLLGMQFGLWVEPEMVSEDSDLYREHPDWAIQLPNRVPALSRTQLVLDYTRQEVRDYVVEALSKVFSSANITYLKWDMNRPMSDVYSASLPSERQGEFYHRYMLGLYEVLDRFTKRFPDILLESCSGGGNRFDLGMLCYSPQVWTSDNTDAVCRLSIQQGTSYGYPLSTMGAHVSAVPNHQSGRITPLETRFNVAAFGCLGYELDVTKLSPEEKDVVRRQVAYYKRHRKLFQYGTFYRVDAPLDKKKTIWTVVSPDRTEAVAGWYQVLEQPTYGEDMLKTLGLNPEWDYIVDGREQECMVFGNGKPLCEEHYEAGGDMLNYRGIKLKQQSPSGGGLRQFSDFGSRTYAIKKR